MEKVTDRGRVLRWIHGEVTCGTELPVAVLENSYELRGPAAQVALRCMSSGQLKPSWKNAPTAHWHIDCQTTP